MYGSRERGGFFKTFITALLTSAVVGLVLIVIVSGYIARNLPSPQSSQSGTQNVPPPQRLALENTGGTAGGNKTAGTAEKSFSAADAAKSATPGVVGISVLQEKPKSIFSKNSDDTWGVGSGVIVSPDGYILTNNHVAGTPNKRIVVSLFDGSNLDGTTVWADPVLDLAVVKINASGLNTIPLGDANALQVGEPAIAIGNPLGLQFQRTVTSGIVSALNRTIQIDTDKGSNFMEDLIQTDASINPGNSGGPLLNTSGQVVGINTVKITTAAGMGFAIPINAAKPIIKHFIDEGKFLEPYLGVFAYDKEVMPFVDSNIAIDKGVYVSRIDKAGPAYKSGLRVGSIISRIDGNDINTMLELRTYIYTKKPGDKVNITEVSSDGKTSVVPVTLAQKTSDGLVTR
ncbi:MAG: trypsin-like peptidase domain-containing protein [Bacillota bacterium]|nr:trypsin-like peptidase domain-containing protein [Bacillota bacterium]